MIKKNKQKSVLLGMSGGVDSSVSALILKKKGYKVTGAFLKMYSDTKNPLTGECSYLEDLKMARKIAVKLNIPLKIIDYENEYKSRVLVPMFSSYKSGLTPNPDISCNTIIKFPFLWKEAKKLGCDYIATGHYSKIKKTKSGYSLLAGKDKTKDQSYFLSGLTQADLTHTIFPLNNMTKKQVRQIAKKSGFPNWNRHGTAGICFVGNIRFQDFLKKKLKQKLGRVLSPENKQLGTHIGSHYYTIGQKAGEHVGIKINKPRGYEQSRYYIAEKRKNNIIIVAPESHPLLKKKFILIKSLHLINSKEKIPNSLKARIRHLGNLTPASIRKREQRYIIKLKAHTSGLAKGQYLVLYKNDRVIGSGIISEIR